MKKIHHKKGMTLVELMATTAIVAFLIVVVSSLLVRSIDAYRISNKSISLQEDAAKVMREFEYSSRAASEILVSDEFEFSYFRYFDLVSSSPTMIRFFMDNGEFKMGRTEPQGTEPNITYPVNSEVITLLIDNAISTDPIFTYYDGLGNPLIAPVSLSAVKLVEIIITVDDDINSQPAAVTERTKIHLRNMKTNL